MRGTVFGGVGGYLVPVGETIVSVLQRQGIAVRTSCELGYCGTCLTPYLAGEPDHRGQVLEENGRKRYVLDLLLARENTDPRTRSLGATISFTMAFMCGKN